jgi:hypothetical protein
LSAASTAESPFAVEVREGRGTVKLLALQSCEGVVFGAVLDVEVIAVLNKPSKHILDKYILLVTFIVFLFSVIASFAYIHPVYGGVLNPRPLDDFELERKSSE